MISKGTSRLKECTLVMSIQYLCSSLLEAARMDYTASEGETQRDEARECRHRRNRNASAWQKAGTRCIEVSYIIQGEQILRLLR